MSDEIDIIIYTPEDFITIDDIQGIDTLDLTYLGSQNYSWMENEVIRLTNLERQQHGLKLLSRNEQLCQSALVHTLDMAENRFISHTASDGTDLKYRIDRAGYRGYLMIGENLASGQLTPEEVVNGWMNSPGHRANILRSEYNEIGVAYILGDVATIDGSGWLKGGYWTQHFGFRPIKFS
jgi:uncharacterized protein YkwD